MLENQLTLVISSCDRFSDLWETSLMFLQKNWGNRGIRTILLTDKPTSYTHEGVEVYCAGEGLEYPQRMKALLGTISTEYILVTLDDYFLIQPVENERIQRLLSVMDTEKIDYIRMFADPDSNVGFKEYHDLYQIDLNENYAVNLYQSIWRASFLSATLKDSISIWNYEVSLSRTAKRLCSLCVLSKGGEFEILDVIRKGKILHKAKRYLKRQHIELENRSVLPYRIEFKNGLFDFGRKILPDSAARRVKAVLRRCGVKFISDYETEDEQ